MDDLIFSYIALSMSFTALFYNLFCILNKKKRKKKSMCDTCAYCIQKINCKDHIRYFATVECPFRFTGDAEVDQHLGTIELCNAYKRRTDNA